MNQLNNSYVFGINSKVKWLIKKWDLSNYKETKTKTIDRVLSRIWWEKLFRYNYILPNRMIRIIIDTALMFNSRFWHKQIDKILDIIIVDIKKSWLVSQIRTHLAIEIATYMLHPTARQVIFS